MALEEDINTGRKQAEETLREKEARLRRITDNMLDIITETDLGGIIQYVSPSNKSVLGYEPEEILGRSIYDFMHPDDLGRVMAAVLAAFTTSSPGKMEYRFRHADGRYLWLESVGNLLFDDRGMVTGAIFGTRDITERKRTEDALKESEAKYRTIFENTGTATVIIEEDTTISLANNEFTKLSGYPKEEIEGRKRWIDFISPKDLERSSKYHYLRRVEPGAAPRQYEVELINKKGDIRDILITVDIIPGTKKSVASVLDITERKKTEERLKYLSFHDVLTGLFNRSFFEEELKRLNVKRQMPLSTIMGDVDDLKMVNDTLGHQEGDKLLIRAAEILVRMCRKDDIICRWGGDEFAILLPKTDRETAEGICNRIRRACQELETDSVPLSFSLGVTTKEDIDQAIETVLREAEDMMYREKLMDRRNTRFSMVAFFQRALAEKSPETLEHGDRIKDLVAKMGERLGLSDREKDELDILAALHDIGEIAIPGDILVKPCYLTDEEWGLMKKHPEIGERITRSVPNLTGVAEAILAHHEFWDGTGYPRGLKGEQIPLYSRILAIADAFDVMTSGRPYKKAISRREALAEIERCAGTQFDPELVKLFTEAVS